MILDTRPTTDLTMRTPLGTRRGDQPRRNASVDPVGMTRTDAARLIRLLEMADASRDGDEQAAIARLTVARDAASPVAAR